MDKVLDDVETVCEDAPQKKLWHDMQRLYAEDLPALPLYFRANPFIMPKWLKGVTPTGAPVHQPELGRNLDGRIGGGRAFVPLYRRTPA